MTRKAILWDFEGTLAEREGLWSGCLAEVLQANESAAGFTRDDIRPFLRDGFPWHAPDVPHPELSSPEAWWKVIEELLFDACRGLGLSEQSARRYAHETHHRYIDAAAFTLFNDTLPVLTELQGDGWRHIILSNHVPELTDIVEGLGLNTLVEGVVSSAVTGYEKPNPKAFDLGRKAAGEVDELWMVGDNPAADIFGAEAAGIPGILVRTEGAGVTRVAKDLYGLRAYLG